MIIGKVTTLNEARVSLTILAPDRQTHHVEAVIDTGFDGFLTLPSQVVHALRLPPAGNRRVILGDGSLVELDTYIGGVVWHGDEREILVLQTDGDLVAGMALLYGSRVIMDIVEDGDVTIESLP